MAEEMLNVFGEPLPVPNIGTSPTTFDAIQTRQPWGSSLSSFHYFSFHRYLLTLLAVVTVNTCMSPAFGSVNYLPTSDAIGQPPLTTRQVIIRKTENFLTNPLFEGIRKIDQLDHDTDTATSNKVILLLPIVDILNDLEKVKLHLQNYKSAVLNIKPLVEAQEILSNDNKYQKVIFKKIFNRYSDNIYYSDPERANLYLAGGAMPGTRQTEQYLFRNEALTAIENVKEDIRILLEKGEKVDIQEVDDGIDDCKEALMALQSYLKLADPMDVDTAKTIASKT
jgi:hypothetical protein